MSLSRTEKGNKKYTNKATLQMLMLECIEQWINEDALGDKYHSFNHSTLTQDKVVEIRTIIFKVKHDSASAAYQSCLNDITAEKNKIYAFLNRSNVFNDLTPDVVTITDGPMSNPSEANPIYSMEVKKEVSTSERQLSALLQNSPYSTEKKELLDYIEEQGILLDKHPSSLRYKAHLDAACQLYQCLCSKPEQYTFKQVKKLPGANAGPLKKIINSLSFEDYATYTDPNAAQMMMLECFDQYPIDSDHNLSYKVKTGYHSYTIEIDTDSKCSENEEITIRNQLTEVLKQLHPYEPQGIFDNSFRVTQNFLHPDNTTTHLKAYPGSEVFRKHKDYLLQDRPHRTHKNKLLNYIQNRGLERAEYFKFGWFQNKETHSRTAKIAAAKQLYQLCLNKDAKQEDIDALKRCPALKQGRLKVIADDIFKDFQLVPQSQLSKR